jgi:glucokinase
VIDDTIRKSKIDQINIKNMGIGVSGIVDYPSGTIRDTDPTRGRTRVSFLKFASSIEDKFGVPVYIGNDASCAAFGEKTLNPAAGFDNVIYLYSDVGCGIVINGDVYIGSSGCAGETQLTFNSHQVDDKDRPAEYVHLRPWGVDLGVVYEAGRMIDKGAATEILNLAKGDKSAITKEIIIDAAKKGDKVAVELLNNAGRNLGIRIAYLINLLNPSVVVIGGGMERAGDLLFEPVKATMKRYSFEEPSGIVKVMPSLLGEDAIVLGAAALAAREVFIQV